MTSISDSAIIVNIRKDDRYQFHLEQSLSKNHTKGLYIMKLTTAILTNAPRTVETKYGTKTVLDAVRTDNNEAITLWRPANDTYCQKLGKNSRVSVGIDHKNKPNLIEDDSITSDNLPVKPVYQAQKNDKPSDCEHFFLSPNQKREVAAYIATMKDLYGYCLQQSESLGLQGEDRRAVATTLYLSAQKKFAL